MASTAMLALLLAGASSIGQAQTETTDTQQPAATDQPVDQGAATTETDATLTPEEPTIATAFIGRSVFSSEDPESDNIGDVNDLIIGDEGKITHAVVGVGGFLGIGEKDVAVPFDELQVVENEDGEIRLIYAATKEQLEEAEAFDRTAFDPEARADAEQQAAIEAEQPADATTEPAPMAADPNAPAEDLAAADATAEQPADAMATDQAAAPAEPAAPAEETAAADATAEQPADAMATDQAAPAEPAAPAEETAAADATAEQPADATATDQAATEQPAPMAAETDMADAGFLNYGADQMRASTMIGKEVFGPDDASIGEVSDLVLQEDGKTRAALIDVGGFLGVGEKEVAIPFSQIDIAEEGDEARLKVAMTKEELEQLPAFEARTMGEADTAAATDPNAAPAADATADTAASTDPNAAPATDATADMAAADPNAPAAEPQYQTVTQDLSAEQLIGTAVYSPAEENLGEVGDVIFDQAGDIEAVVVDVGGFLGVGEKPVAVQFDALNVQKDTNGDIRLLVNATQEQLEQAPPYNEEAAQVQ